MIGACFDIKFDQQEGLQSIPAKFGISTVLQLSSIMHFITIVLLVIPGFDSGLGLPYWIGMIFVAGLLAWQPLPFQPDGLSKLGVAISKSMALSVLPSSSPSLDLFTLHRKTIRIYF